jgi:DNA-binding beta-propeller fold protein YncE
LAQPLDGGLMKAFLITFIFFEIFFCNINTLYANQQQIEGVINHDTTWEGNILIVNNIIVNEGVILTIKPGTKIYFKHYRGYKEPSKRLEIDVYGTIIAQGTPNSPIYFTSDAEKPQNGDWSMIHLEKSFNSKFEYCVIEFAQQGLNVWNSDPIISHCVIRWNNWEGLYFESYCKPIIENTQIYENGYNGLAAEQFNTITMKQCEVYRNGTNGIHIDASTGEIIQCNVHENSANGISVDDSGILKIYGTIIKNYNDCAIGYGQGINSVQVSNVNLDYNKICGSYEEIQSSISPIEQINIGFQPTDSYFLGYIPGDVNLDKYNYVYPDYDITRKVIKKIGKGLGLSWSLAWDGQYIWSANLDGNIYKIDPETGNIIKEYNTSFFSQPWGMTFDGENLWIVDFAQKKLFKFDINTGQILSSFPTPDPNGGCKGITWDGNYLYVLGWTSSVIYKIDRDGNLIDTVILERGGGGGITWDGKSFWVSDQTKILKYDKSGKLVGWIYSASEGTWDLTWDGKYLWASQRTNENWNDAKIFKVQILNDNLQKIVPEIQVNGSFGQVSVNNNESNFISISLINYGMEGINADWWLAADTPFGFYFYSYLQKSWLQNTIPVYQGPLFSIADVDLLSVSNLPQGKCTVYFGVDTMQDGKLTFEELSYDYIEINIIGQE